MLCATMVDAIVLAPVYRHTPHTHRPEHDQHTMPYETYHCTLQPRPTTDASVLYCLLPSASATGHMPNHPSRNHLPIRKPRVRPRED